MLGEPICVRTLSSHCRGPFRCSSIQQGVLVTVCRLRERERKQMSRMQTQLVREREETSFRDANCFHFSRKGRHKKLTPENTALSQFHTLTLVMTVSTGCKVSRGLNELENKTSQVIVLVWAPPHTHTEKTALSHWNSNNK